MIPYTFKTQSVSVVLTYLDCFVNDQTYQNVDINLDREEEDDNFNRVKPLLCNYTEIGVIQQLFLIAPVPCLYKICRDTTPQGVERHSLISQNHNLSYF